ncbi:MAG: hypothetical protein ACKPKO_46820, partial [Candidatus Fonsibacter sp.]
MKLIIETYSNSSHQRYFCDSLRLMIRTAIFTLLLLIIPGPLVIIAQQADTSIQRVDSVGVSRPLEYAVKYKAEDSTVMELQAN